jgi:hypothetical protein
MQKNPQPRDDRNSDVPREIGHGRKHCAFAGGNQCRSCAAVFANSQSRREHEVREHGGAR